QAGGGFEKMWPRTSVKGRDGGLNLAPDHSYKLLDGDCVVTPFEVQYEGDVLERRQEPLPASPSGNENPGQPHDVPLFESGLDADTARLRLTVCPRLNLTVAPQHQFVRQEEQSQFELAIRTGQRVWLVADWGTGK